jgi:hypothetical protein
VARQEDGGAWVHAGLADVATRARSTVERAWRTDVPARAGIIASVS